MCSNFAFVEKQLRWQHNVPSTCTHSCAALDCAPVKSLRHRYKVSTLARQTSDMRISLLVLNIVQLAVGVLQLLWTSILCNHLGKMLCRTACTTVPLC